APKTSIVFVTSRRSAPAVPAGARRFNSAVDGRRAKVRHVRSRPAKTRGAPRGARGSKSSRGLNRNRRAGTAGSVSSAPGTSTAVDTEGDDDALANRGGSASTPQGSGKTPGTEARRPGEIPPVDRIGRFRVL